MKKMYIMPKGTEINTDVVRGLILSSQRRKDIRQYNALETYYEDGFITERPAPHQLLAVTNYARYIVKTNVGYLMGNPVSYSASEGVDITKILEKYDAQVIGNLDVELETDSSIFGHAFERIYLNDNKEPESVAIDPRNVILVHDDSVKHRKMFAIIYTNKILSTGKISRSDFDVTILDGKRILEGELTNGNLRIIEAQRHLFGEVPVVEYPNSSDRIGDFETVTNLIDARNILQSDRVLDRERLVDAILALYGTTLTPDQQKQIKTDRIVANVPVDAKIEYVVKNINEADASVLLKSITDDIHKVSMTPDMSDENFAGQASGVALSYKLLAFEQHAKDKERYFEKGLLERFGIYNTFLHSIAGGSASVKDVDVLFKRALPKNDYETSQMVNNLLDTGLIDRETLAGQFSFVRNPKEIVEMAQKEAFEKFESPNDAEFAKNEITDRNKLIGAKEE